MVQFRSCRYEQKPSPLLQHDHTSASPQIPGTAEAFSKATAAAIQLAYRANADTILDFVEQTFQQSWNQPFKCNRFVLILLGQHNSDRKRVKGTATLDLDCTLDRSECASSQQKFYAPDKQQSVLVIARQTRSSHLLLQVTDMIWEFVETVRSRLPHGVMNTEESDQLLGIIQVTAKINLV